MVKSLTTIINNNIIIMKKYLTFGLLAVILAVLGMVGVSVYAQTSSVSSGPGSPSSGGVSPMILNIGPNGNVLMRGEVLSVGTNTLTVKSWGGSWDVNVLATTQIISLNKVLSDIAVGEFVGVLGTVVSDGSYEVDARIVREWGRKVDHDHDGISDDQDSDDDNDGVLDINERGKSNDHDDDGINDDQDSDDDNDGVLDINERGKSGDHDNDGIRDSRDRDDDNDGVPDVSDSKPHDNDDDGEDDAEDDDDDNDGKDDDEDDDDDDNGIDDDEEGEDDDNSGSGGGN